MNRPLRVAILALTIGIALLTAGKASATTYYIAANGSDSNSGTSTSSPWLHAPGMPNCSGACAATTPQPGDNLIFRGGDAWHFGNSSLSPYTGGTWNWHSGWSGNSTSCNLNVGAGAVTRSSCIYVGVDTSWYSGSSFTRPILSNDNPLSTGRPSSCAYDDGSINDIDLNGAQYLIFDNFEITGRCWNTGSTTQAINMNSGSAGNMVEISDVYYHGWTMGTGAHSDDVMIGGQGPGTDYQLITGIVCDGSDSSSGTSTTNSSGFCIAGLGPNLEISKSIFNHVSNGCQCSVTSLHDNLFENMYVPISSAHGNVIEQLQASVSNIYAYNNVLKNTGTGSEDYYFQPGVGSNLYFFNDVSYADATSGDCLVLVGNGSSGPANYYIYNDTFDYQSGTNGCSITFEAPGGSSEMIDGTAYYENNHLVGAYSPQSMAISGCCSALNNETLSMPSLTITDDGGEVWQSEASANAQGYSRSSNYAPTGSSGATVGMATNLASSCSIFSPDSALCSGSSGGVSEQSGNGGEIAAYNSAPPRNIPPGCTPTAGLTGCWDAGAYMMSSSVGASQPVPPTGLAASAQ
jgi:hypothetical protein